MSSPITTTRKVGDEVMAHFYQPWRHDPHHIGAVRILEISPDGRFAKLEILVLELRLCRYAPYIFEDSNGSPREGLIGYTDEHLRGAAEVVARQYSETPYIRVDALG